MVDSLAVAAADSLSAEVMPESVEAATSTVAAEPVVEASAAAFSHYVVYGVFSTEQNAAKGVEQAQRKDETVECRVIPYKNKYMVTIFGSNSSSECQRYVNRSPIAGLWIYNAK